MKRRIVLIIVIALVIAGAAALSSFLEKRSERQGVITPLGNTETSQELTISAEAYYVDNNEAEGAVESAYLEGDAAKSIGEMLSGEYETEKGIAEIDEYRFVITPVYIGRSLDEIDKYSVDFVPDDDSSGTIYGPAIYVIDEKTIGIWSPESGNCWIAKKKGGAIDVQSMAEFAESAQKSTGEEIDEEAE